ncbi:MAG: DNA mismatch repair endonuclease MutL [Clostridia bacterium]|nr:DNA mismatch repair endonuclease MutL [Clostridia bacterium]
MGKIVLLDELTINQIAAGEVIERPASVVKEMVENSIDAGATNIYIDVKDGGITSIRIADNGKGIAADDMEMAFERHATSKIRTAEDLNTVKSMGFRGEALASVASIANVEMISKTEDEEFGQKLVIEAGNILEKGEVGAGIGTTITVRNLFFNTPVRYKFLKKDYTESGYIEDAITRLALINPNIAFKFTNNDKVVIQTTGDGNVKNCIYSIFGKDIANGIIDLNYEFEGIKITGVIGKPTIARNNRTNQMFFINKRYVKDKTLSAAIEQAYKGMLTVGKHAFCIVNIDMDPSEVDVNVHPAKLEVRFKEENKVFKAIYHAVKESLLNTDLVVHAGQEEKTTNDLLPQYNEKIEENTDSRNKFTSLFKRKNQSVNWDKEEVNSRVNLVEELYRQKKEGAGANTSNLTENNSEANISQDVGTTISQPGEEINNKAATTESEVKLNFEEMYEKTFGKKIPDKLKEEQEQYNVDVITEVSHSTENNTNITQDTEASITRLENSDNAETNKEEQVPAENLSMFENQVDNVEPVKYKIIGIVFLTYIILEVGNEMFMIDQHAAHERVLYEKIKKNFYDNKEKESQLMLLPDIINLSHKDFEIARANFEMFEKAGFTLEEFGENTIKLTGVPNICIDLDTKELFLNILDEIGTVSVTSKQQIEEKFIATVACKSAVKAGMVLQHQEVEALMDELFKLPNPYTCPHGRPTTIRMSRTDLEKKFKRIQ